jgi:hypothetical protein
MPVQSAELRRKGFTMQSMPAFLAFPADQAPASVHPSVQYIPFEKSVRRVLRTDGMTAIDQIIHRVPHHLIICMGVRFVPFEPRAPGRLSGSVVNSRQVKKNCDGTRPIPTFSK